FLPSCRFFLLTVLVLVRMFFTEGYKYILQRWANLMNVDLADTGLAERGFDLFWPYAILDQEVHRLAKHGCAAHAIHFMRGFERTGHVITGHVQSPRSGRAYFGQFFEVVRFAANDQFRHVDVAHVIAPFGFIHVMGSDE